MLLCILDLLVWTPLWLLHFSKWPIMRNQCQLHFWCNLMALLSGKGSNIKSAHTLPAAAHGSVCVPNKTILFLFILLLWITFYQFFIKLFRRLHRFVFHIAVTSHLTVIATIDFSCVCRLRRAHLCLYYLNIFVLII